MSKILIENIEYNTSKEEDRRFIGLYFENKFYDFLIKNNLKYHYISNENPFLPFDFIKKKNGNLKILELKTRLKNITTHSSALIDYEKIQKYKKIQQKHPNSNFFFVFNYVDVDNEFYYYKIDFNFLENLDIKMIFNKKTYILPIEYLKKLSDNLEILK